MSLIREFILISLVVCIGSAYSLLSGLAPEPWAKPELLPGEIRFDAAAALSVHWVDARSSDDFHSGHLPEAIWFDRDNWDESLILVAERWLMEPRPIIVYCSSKGCSTSREVAEQLRIDLPDAEIYSLKGGWQQ